MENWKPVVGYKGYYEISDKGNIRSVDRNVECKDGSTRFYKGKPLNATPNRDGHMQVHLKKAGNRKAQYVHTLVLEAHVSERPLGAVCCHADGNTGNNVVDNLRWDTQSSNLYDSSRHGTHWQVAKKLCPRGHDLDNPNNIHKKRAQAGHRSCRACSNARARARHYGLDASQINEIADRYYQEYTAGPTN